MVARRGPFPPKKVRERWAKKFSFETNKAFLYRANESELWPITLYSIDSERGEAGKSAETELSVGGGSLCFPKRLKGQWIGEGALLILRKRKRLSFTKSKYHVPLLLLSTVF